MKASTTFSNYGVGLNVFPNNNTLVELGNIYLNPLVSVTGTLYVDDNNTSWNAQQFNGLRPDIIALDENGVEWQSETTADGQFSLQLAAGIYDFMGAESEYNITTVNDWNVTDFILDTIVNLTANIEPVSIDVYVCLSNDDVENCDESSLLQHKLICFQVLILIHIL